MAIIATTQFNPLSKLDEITKYRVVPKNMIPTKLANNTHVLLSVPDDFHAKWYMYYFKNGDLFINLQRKSVEAGQGV